MREVKKMWFVIDTRKDWSQQWVNGFETEEEARKFAQYQWDYLTDKEKKERFIQVAEMDAVYDEDKEKWMPVEEWDEEYEQGMSYMGAYNPVLTLQVEEETLIKVYADINNGITEVDDFRDMPDEFEETDEEDFVERLDTLGEDEVIGAEISESTYEKLKEEYGIRKQ